MRIAFIGVGAMGQPMALKLMQHHDLCVFDIDDQKGAPLAAAGACLARSPADAAAGARVVFVMVATPEQLHVVLTGDDGLAGRLRVGTTVVVMATVGIEPIVAAADALGRDGVALVDAPVTGGVARAQSGELTILVGAAERDLDVVRPLLELFAARVAHCGSRPGDGQAVKLVNQMLCSVHLAAAGEALAFAARLGLDPGLVLDAISEGAAASFMLSDRGPRMLESEPPVRSAIDIFVKDSALVADAARRVGAATPFTDLAHDVFVASSAGGIGRSDDSQVIRYFEGATQDSVCCTGG